MKRKLKITALIAARNEADVIYYVISDLVQQGIEVYLIDNCSTDSTVKEASRWLGKGLIHIEKFPDDANYPRRSADEYVWTDILKRKEELAETLGSDWYIHHDADEFRESPFPGMSLRKGIIMADVLGFNAIDFALLNFRPTDNSFVFGEDVRNSLAYYDWGETFDSLQIKAWKSDGKRVDLVTYGGHSVLFGGRRIFPLKFILRHYPIRSQQHGEEKVFKQRKARFSQDELDKGWHIQYDNLLEGANFVCDPLALHRYQPNAVRIKVICKRLFNAVKYFTTKISGK